MPIGLSHDDFITVYYAEACSIADKTIGWVVKRQGSIHKSIDVELVKAKGVLDGLEKTYKNYDPEHESGARIKTLLNKVVRNSVLTELGKETTRARRDGWIAPAPKKRDPEEERRNPERGQGFIPGIRLRQSADGPFEAHEYMESIGWAERKEDLIHIATKCLKWLPKHDRIIIEFYFEDKSTYVERSLEELEMENNHDNASWVYQRRDKAIKAIQRFFKKEEPNYRDISIDPFGDSNRLLLHSDNVSLTLSNQPERIKASREDHYDYRKVATQLVDFILSSLNTETTQSAASRPLELFLPGEDLSRLEELGIIEKKQTEKGDSDSFGGLNRAREWLSRCDCAILSGWREGNTRKVNDENNRTILNTLKEKGYGLCRCRGYYPEHGKTFSIENSFFTFDRNHSGKDFFESVRSLAEQFDQDSFLYIEANGGKRFLYGTNDDFGKGKKEYLGALHVGAKENECFTRFGNQEMVFKDRD